jgi:cytochrome P450
MRRWVTRDITLSTGFKLRKGSRIVVDSCRMWDASFYPNPDEWQADRFLRLRQAHGTDHTAQLVSTSSDHLAFGHGQHVCPGRFFAAAEIKIVMCHLFSRFDWKLGPGTAVKPFMVGFSAVASPFAEVLFRKAGTGLDTGIAK